MFKYAEIGDIVYFWFAANTILGDAGDGATPSYIVRLAGAAANAAKKSSGTPSLLTHADYPNGLHEIAVDTDGWAAGEYAVFCTLLISEVNPAGFCGSFQLRAAGAASPISSVVALPVMQGRVYAATMRQDRQVEIIQGDTPRITFDLNDDYTGWTAYFGAKAKLADTDYAIDPKAATWSDVTTGQGYVDLTAVETATVGKYLGELELRNGDSRLTAIKFTLIIIGGVIKESAP